MNIVQDCCLLAFYLFQVVPDWSAGNERPSKRKFSKCDTSPSDFAADIAYILGKCDELPEFMLQVRMASLICKNERLPN